ncbi:glycogen synthase kinase binding protein [Sardina pilchardus]|uniref:glycogen synthase kinase binding protein n=1 Tax=Sardina pilchardus TaxID=27697 RepID=UPI002E1468ED
MPCRKENYILLEQSVTVDSKEVDALVTKIGEVLQLHNNSANQKTMSCLHGLTSNGSSNVKQTNNNTGAQPRRTGCCIRFRSRGVRSRASPYNIPGSSDQEWDNFKTWNRKRTDVTRADDNPHQLLQELILSGNLIKEAVRRLQFSPSERGERAKTIDNASL